MNYTDYLQSGWWKSRRAEAIRKAEYRCKLCGSMSNLIVHHKNYNNLWKETDADIIVLCKNCHKIQHGGEFD